MQKRQRLQQLATAKEKRIATVKEGDFFLDFCTTKQHQKSIGTLLTTNASNASNASDAKALTPQRQALESLLPRRMVPASRTRARLQRPPPHAHVHLGAAQPPLDR